MLSKPYAVAPFAVFALAAALATNGCIDDTILNPSLRGSAKASGPAANAPDGGTPVSLVQSDASPPRGQLNPAIPPTSGRHPEFAPTVVASSAPPPISGGTLLVTRDNRTVVASDPDRDAVYIVDVTTQTLTATVSLQSGDEPGRLAEDFAGRVHVALRGGGALVTLDVKQGSIVARRSVCPAPRGAAWDASTDLVWVACATGELVGLPATGGAATRSFVVERDLRDVIVHDGAVSVTKFRSGETLRLDGNGNITRRDALPGTTQGAGPGLRTLSARVAWRAIAKPTGEMVIVHQEESDQDIMARAPGAYGGGGSGGGSGGPIVEGELSSLSDDGSVSTQMLIGAVLPVDVALSPDGTLAVVSAGASYTVGLSPVTLNRFAAGPERSLMLPSMPSFAGSEPTAVAFDAAGNLFVQSREPAELWVVPPAGAATSIALSSMSRADTGHAIFHTQAGGLIACASCHPEGREDGKVWLLDSMNRRTPSLLGTISGTAPYHWPGDEADLSTLVNDVYTKRMNGVPLEPEQMSALAGWVQSLPAPPMPSWVDSHAAQHGRALFEGPAGCASCHSGPKFTNNATMDIGTGADQGSKPDGGAARAAFQVPPLVGVGWRTPLLHNGCAATIADRFDKCATPQHGSTSNLSPRDVSDLTAYLESL
jgi:hypothetical protein